MKFLDAKARLQHPCQFLEFSKEFRDIEMATWCNIDCEVIQITALDSDQIEEVLARAKEVFSARQVAGDSNTALLVSKDCMCTPENSVSTIAEKYNSWSVPPILYFGGWETHRLICRSKRDLKGFAGEVNRIGKIEIISMKERDQLDMLNSLGVVPVHFFGGLTDRQLRALITAFENGLLEIPARTKMDKIAKMEGLSRSTYGEHLRKAIFQLVENSYPMLKLYSKGGMVPKG